MKPQRRNVPNKSKPPNAPIDHVERIKAGIRAKVEHLFRVIERQFGYTMVRYHGMKKNAAQLVILFAQSNLRMTRDKLLRHERVPSSHSCLSARPTNAVRHMPASFARR